MTDIPVLITISRTAAAGGPDPLVISGSIDENALGVTDFKRPGLNARITYAPDSRYFDGSEETAVAWDQGILAFSWVPDQAENETDNQASHWEVAAAIAQRRFDVTTQVSDAPAEVWRAKRGSMIPDARSYSDLVNNNPVYALTIPVHPIPTTGG